MYHSVSEHIPNSILDIIRLSAGILQIVIGKILKPDFDGFGAMDVCEEVTRTFSQASTRLLLTISKVFRGSGGEHLIKTYPKKIENPIDP